MNTLRGQIQSIRKDGHLLMVNVVVGKDLLKVLLIDSSPSPDYLQEGNGVNVLFKETEVIICKGNAGLISLENRMNAKVAHIEKGDVLSKVKLTTASREIKAILTTDAMDVLQLKVGDEVQAMMKVNEVMLSAI
jgi:molybdate transport system regulatory protein